ncbi:class D beta-lactamase [Fulvivirga sp. M361]|uniref:class D beta-lactamase n=1 Tax=Fulvivirga sp. M361 TaxID=2594266 RepID=UPI0011798D24|nr:class D beta-lactamase [Fulvivirga sp. M361]TRX62597.1 class D beta-lactamase [Fulvivirga sp. M361]
MKYSLFLVSLVIFTSCSERKNKDAKEISEVPEDKHIVTPEFQSLIDSAHLEGTILIYDLQQDLYYSNDYKWAGKGHLPASTFKIVNSIIGLETGILEDDSTLFKWNGEKRALENWEQDLILRDAFHYSCVPCYQEVARKIGEKRMNEYLDKLDYGDIKIDSGNIDVFWLEGESRINPFQQIDFLKRFSMSELPISERTEGIMKQMMVMEANEKYVLRGKTGWSVRNGNNNGWFVGYVETTDGVYFFAVNVEPREQFNMKFFPMIKKEVAYRALRHMGIMAN